MKMWSGRFGGSLDPTFERWQRSFGFDYRLLPHELAASRAHARALKEVGVLTAEELITVLQGLEEIGKQVRLSPEFLDDQDAEDVHHFVEKRLVGLIGDVGYKLHSGRSRNEQIATDLRLYIRASIDRLATETAVLCEAIVGRAEQSGNAAMPAYTHLQRAEPVLVGLPQAAECFSVGFGRGGRCNIAAESRGYGGRIRLRCADRQQYGRYLGP